MIAASAIPVHILTGFLGSGKTTLLNRLLAAPEMGDSAVVINEFGDVAIDHALVSEAKEDLLLLKSGCVCCSVRGDLVDALTDLAGRTKMGEIPAFSRVVIETTGLADPGPVIQTLMTDPALVGRFRQGSVTTTVDVLNVGEQLDRHSETARQIAAADRIVLTKLDLDSRAARAALASRLDALNPGCPLVEADRFGAENLKVAEGPLRLPETHNEHAGDEHAGHGGVVAHCLVRDKPLDWDGFARWLDSLTALRGADVLRIKGIVSARDCDRPIAVDGVHHLLHEPRMLDAWPDGRRETRLVIITENIDRLALEAGLEAAGA